MSTSSLHQETPPETTSLLDSFSAVLGRNSVSDRAEMEGSRSHVAREPLVLRAHSACSQPAGHNSGCAGNNDGHTHTHTLGRLAVWRCSSRPWRARLTAQVLVSPDKFANKCFSISNIPARNGVNRRRNTATARTKHHSQLRGSRCWSVHAGISWQETLIPEAVRLIRPPRCRRAQLFYFIFFSPQHLQV